MNKASTGIKAISGPEYRLTSEGWKWEKNEPTMAEILPSAMFQSYAPFEGRDKPIPDEEIMGKYQGRFPNMDIRLEQAYDIHGTFLPWHRAVYVRERGESEK